MVAKALFSHKYIMLLTILTDNHPTLRQKSSSITSITPELKKLAQNMIETMNYGKRGVGLAAPQVGINKRLIVCKIRLPKGGYEDVAMINPQIFTKSESCEIGEEGCLSVPNLFGPVKRASEITLQYQSLDKKMVLKRYTGMNARVIQHEIDHLDGILFTDLVSDKREIFEEVNF